MPAEKKPEDLTPYEYWNDELSVAYKELKEKFHDKGDKVVDKFLDKENSDDLEQIRLNLFHSNIVTLRSMLFGQQPKVDVSRRFQDASDDVGRVASLLFERLLNNDIELETDTYQDALRYALDDFLIPGLGTARVRYDMEEKEGAVTNETVPTDYVHWKDFLWSPCRTWNECRWVAFRTYLRKNEVVKYFSEEIADRIEFKSNKGDEEDRQKDPQKCAEIWEIWDKEERKVCWFSFGYKELLKKKDDPLKLSGFWPCPRPMLANTTTKSLIPKPEYTYAQDLYEEVDVLESRIARLTRACKAAGVYDKNSDGVQRLLNEGVENTLIPVESWAAFAEKGGLKGQIDWLPIEEIAKVIDILSAKRTEKINLLYQTTGMSDILRGSTDPRETKGAQELKSRFASVRIQAIQDMFAEFASDLQRLKAEIISRHFSPESIFKQANATALSEADKALLQPAMELIKSPDDLLWRITVRPESVAMMDYAQLKQERTEYINALAMYMQSSAPLLQVDTGITPYLLELLKWGLAGFKGSAAIEGTIDRAIVQAQQAAAQKASQPPPPDPKVEAQKAKAQADMQQAQMEFQLDVKRMQAEMQMEAAKFQREMAQDQQKHQLEIQKMQMEIAMLQQKLGIEREKMEMEAEGKAVDLQLQRERGALQLQQAQVSGEQKIESAAEMAKIKAKQANRPRKPNGA